MEDALDIGSPKKDIDTGDGASIDASFYTTGVTVPWQFSAHLA